MLWKKEKVNHDMRIWEIQMVGSDQDRPVKKMVIEKIGNLAIQVRMFQADATSETYFQVVACPAY